MQIPRYWREIDERYNLTGTACGNCGHVFFPKRSLCPECRHLSVGKLKDTRFAGTGTVETFTRVHQPPDEFAQDAPYLLGIVRLDEGPRVTAQIVDVDPDEIRIGTRVEARFRRLGKVEAAGVVNYGYKFGPIRTQPS